MLTNWLALCLYDYMKDYAGSSLFVLFKAIKFQVGLVHTVHAVQCSTMQYHTVHSTPYFFHNFQKSALKKAAVFYLKIFFCFFKTTLFTIISDLNINQKQHQ